MTRLAAVPALPEHQCLLCGEEAETFVDLCDRCNRTFVATAERVAAAVLAARLPRGVVVEHVAGQLELDGEDQ